MGAPKGNRNAKGHKGANQYTGGSLKQQQVGKEYRGLLKQVTASHRAADAEARKHGNEQFGAPSARTQARLQKVAKRRVTLKRTFGLLPRR